MSSKIRHVVLTGPPGVGKTTLVQKSVALLQQKGLACHGFVTQEVRQAGKRVGFDIITLDGKQGVLSRIKSDGSGGRQPMVGNYAVDVQGFEALALPIVGLQSSKTSILVLDEIGKMELFSNKFVSNVRKLLASPDTTILTTIPIQKGRPIPLVEEIRNRKDILLINLSRDNRNDVALLDNIVEILVSSLGK